MSEPLVSVILPTYNRGPLLQQAVASVVAQTFGDWELIVVDDGSTDRTDDANDTDDTAARVARVGDPRIRLLARSHGGAAAARNAGLDAARGHWVAFLDSDDLWLPDKLERQLSALRNHPDCRWSCTGVGFIDADGAPTAQHAGSAYHPESGWIVERMLRAEATVSIQTVVVERTLAVDAGGFDTTLRFREDLDFEYRLAARAPICALAEPLTLIREHAGRTTRHEPESVLYECAARVSAKVERSLDDPRLRAICRSERIVHTRRRASALRREGRFVSCAIGVLSMLALMATAPLLATQRRSGRTVSGTTP
jgi:GT2 family glycosyltransferase